VFANRLNELLCLSLNHLISQESWALTRLRAFSGAHVSIVGLPLPITLKIDEHGLFTSAENNSEPDVTLSLPVDAFGKAIVSPDKLMSSVKISGSVDLAEGLGFIFRNLRWDMESDLARFIGDIPAHRLSRIGSSLATQAADGIHRAAQNIVEYSRDESQLLVSNSELMQFGSEVDALRDDLARLEQRLRRI
jgi:ubiquinone biosynthesis protein UbiJ